MDEIRIIPSSALSNLTYWPTLHTIIQDAFDFGKDLDIFPIPWQRLHADVTAARDGLITELGSKGQFAIAFHDQQPVACAGFTPYHHKNHDEFYNASKKKHFGDFDVVPGEAIAAPADEEISSTPISDWELCCVATSPAYMGRGLCARLIAAIEARLRDMQAKRLYATWVEAEKGQFWPSRGFAVVDGYDDEVPAGFTPPGRTEGLRQAVLFKTGAKSIW